MKSIHYWIKLCLGGLFFLLLGNASAGNHVLDVTQTDQESISLTEYLGVLEDPGTTLTLSDVIQGEYAERFKNSHSRSEALGFSYTKSAVWLRLHLQNSGPETVQRVLEISYALLSQVDVYQPDRNGYQRVALGYSRPVPEQALRSRFVAVPVVIPANTQTRLYIRIQTPNSLNIPARLWHPKAFEAHQALDRTIQAMYFGCVLAICFYNLMLFFAVRDINFLLYVAFAFSVAAALATFTGIGPEFIWGVAPAWTMMGVNVPAAMASVFMLLLARRMLSTATLTPRIDAVLKLFVAVNAASTVLLFLWFQAFTPYFVTMSMITSILILLAGVVCAKMKQRTAYIFLAAYGVLFLANTLTHLRNLGVLPTNIFTSDGMQIGSAIEMLLLSLALADRFNTMRREKYEAEKQSLRIMTDLVSTLKTSKKELEIRVADRTAELLVLNKKLETISATDALTGIANRRQFDTVFAEEWKRAQRLGQPLSLGLLDVDWFKKYNDHYGHQAGDDCLRQVAKVLDDTIGRAGDLVARYGGEEFVFIALSANSEGAMKIARRICEAVQAQALPHALSDFGCVTVSVGVASCVPSETNRPEELLAAADKALYRAKHRGRNQAATERQEFLQHA